MARLFKVVQSRLEVLAASAEARALAATEGVSVRPAQELSLVIAELGMNALRHAGGGVVQIDVGHHGWTVEVKDSGPGLTDEVLRDAGRSDRLGARGVRAPADGQRSFGSGLASVRRMSTRLELSNRDGGGACAVAHRDLSQSSP